MPRQRRRDVVLATPGARVATGTGVAGVGYTPQLYGGGRAHVYGTPYGYGRSATQRATTNISQSQRVPRSTRLYNGAVVAGEPKGTLVRPNHGRGIAAIAGPHDWHDSISTVQDPVKRAMLQEVRESRVTGKDKHDYDRGWVPAEMDVRDGAHADGSRATLAAARGKHGPLGHGPTIITRQTRDMVDALRKELGLDVAMSAQEVIVEARQQFKLEDIDLPLAQDAERLLAALRGGNVVGSLGNSAGSANAYSLGQLSARPLR